MADSAAKMQNDFTTELSKDCMHDLREKLQDYVNNVETPVGNKRKLKILFTGLDASGKTSFLRAIKQKYSELIGIKPTKGIERSVQIVLGTTFIEWDVAGQAKYRKNFIQSADLYLYNTNLVFFLIDIKDSDRYDQALDFLNDIVSKLRTFNQFPPIIINLHKVDPDIINSYEVQQNIYDLKEKCAQLATDFKIAFFETSIFNNYSLIKAFSEGIGLISPNREIFEKQLEWLAMQLNAQSILLINDNSIILSDFSIDQTTGAIFRNVCPSFPNSISYLFRI